MRAIGLGSVLLAFSISSPQSSGILESTRQPGVDEQSQTKAADTPQSPDAPSGKPQASPARPQSPKEEAWQTLEAACAGSKVAERESATFALGLLRNDAKARKLAERALSDAKAEVRSAGAAALGEMGSRRSIPKLRKALDDKDPSVALAAAHALHRMHDRSSYEVFYEVLTKQRKGGKGLLSSQMSTLSDPKKVAQLGLEAGIGFIPFARLGWRAVREVRKDDSSPVRAASALALARNLTQIFSGARAPVRTSHSEPQKSEAEKKAEDERSHKSDDPVTFWQSEMVKLTEYQNPNTKVIFP